RTDPLDGRAPVSSSLMMERRGEGGVGEPTQRHRKQPPGSKPALGSHLCAHRRYSDLKLYQTEQECGDGSNDWRYCRYAWTLMKHYLENGASAYYYWNISLQQGGVSRWGWAQNSLVSVDTAAKTFKYNYEYYLMKHLSRFVKPGAKRLDIFSLTGYENLLVFANPDESVVIMMQNDLCQEMPVRVKVGDKVIASTLEADSFNTFVVYYRA